MGLVFPATNTTVTQSSTTYEKKKKIDINRKSGISREQAVKQLTLRNKIFLRTEVAPFKIKDE